MTHTSRLALAGVLLAGLAATAAGASTICFEAEDVTEVAAPMRVGNKDTVPAGDREILQKASGQAYLEVPEKAGKPPEVNTGKASIRFNVPKSDTYILWIRAWWNDECGNSVTLAIDDARPFSFGQDATYKRWHWVRSPPRIKQLDLDKGAHTLHIINREDGIRLDQILFINTKRYIPVGTEDVTEERK